ncbi:MAG TPA: 1-acyl-sn-glycerol-3-phosphate acyltransferase [Candidatus Limnocylindria bacterium]|nr:1-acyl-sn-glycerol-3-phosphate acyltransferase [Candidatus Limnocylindria bacterium]
MTDADQRTGPRQPGVADSPRYRLMRLANGAVVHSLFRVSADGLERWPDPPFCLVVNHHNGWDPLLILGVVPARPRVTWFGPREADFSQGFKNRVMAYFGGVIPFNPAKTTLTSATRAVRRVFESGGVLGIFAEGRNGFRESDIGPFEEGAIGFATMAGVAVVPCVIVGSTYLWLGKRVTIRFGDPIPTAGVRGAAARAELTERVRAAMRSMLPSHEPAPPGRRPLRGLLTDLLNGPDDVRRRLETLGE